MSISLDPPVATPEVATPVTAAVAELPSPRVRWAGIIWGTVFAALAGGMLWVLTNAAQRANVHEWVLAFEPSTVSPGAIVGAAVLVVGGILLITGAIALLRRTQRQ